MDSVVLDTSPLYVTRAGVARYIKGLIKGFQSCQNSELKVTPYAWEVENFEFKQPTRLLRTFYREVLWSNLIAPQYIKSSGYSLLHSLGIPIIKVPIPGVKHVVTLHDMAPIRNPERFRKWHKYISKVGFKRTIDADAVICVSQFTADEAIECLGLNPKKIHVVHQASDWNPDALPQIEKPKFDLPSDFFLFVGTLEPGKNLQLLKDMYQIAKTRGVNLPPLVVVGVRREGVEKERDSEIDSNIIYAGRVSDSELAWLYSKAVALQFPSKYEGFGIPLLEAMTFGCPVICSKVASLGEVGGDAVIYAQMDPNSYLDVSLELIGNQKLRDSLIHAGLERCRSFSWERNASQVMDIYQSLI